MFYNEIKTQKKKRLFETYVNLLCFFSCTEALSTKYIQPFLKISNVHNICICTYSDSFSST